MLSALEERLAEDFESKAPFYAEQVLGHLGTEVPEVVSDEARRRLASAGSEAVLREFAAVLRHGLGKRSRAGAPAAALAFGQYLAREGVPLASLMRSYRLGQEVLFSRAAQLAAESGEPGDRLDGLARIVLLSFRFSDAALSDVAQEYEAERELVIRGSLAQRSALLADLLADRPVDERAIERTLGYRLDREHLAIVAWSASGALESQPVADAARALARQLGQGRPLLVTDTPGEAWIWVTPAGAVPAGDPAQLLPPGVCAAIGEPGRGRAGFVASRRQADLARTAAGGRRVVRYRDVALVALLLRDPHAARAFADEELGVLAEPTAAAAALRATLAAYFAAGHDQRRAAFALGVHRNTIAKRLRRAEALLGRPLDQRARELDAALAIVAGGGEGS